MYTQYGYGNVCTWIESANCVWGCVCVSLCVWTMLWKCCSHRIGLSVTNEPSGTVTEMKAKDIMDVLVVHAWPLVAHRFCVSKQLCICVSEQYVVWQVGPWKLQAGDSTGLCRTSANLLNCKAQGGSRRGLVFFSRCNLKKTSWLCAPLFL